MPEKFGWPLLVSELQRMERLGTGAEADEDVIETLRKQEAETATRLCCVITCENCWAYRNASGKNHDNGVRDIKVVLAQASNFEAACHCHAEQGRTER